MRVLIGQPLHEDKIEHLENEIKANKDIDFVLFPEGYLANEKALVSAREIAKKYKVTIATSYKRDNKNRALIINNIGEIVLERAKTLPDENIKLYEPSSVIIGTSHADGSYRNCGVSLPISYFIDSDGEAIYISKSDTRTRIVNLTSKEFEIK